MKTNIFRHFALALNRIQSNRAVNGRFSGVKDAAMAIRFRPPLAALILATLLTAGRIMTASADLYTAVDLYTLAPPSGMLTISLDGGHPQTAAAGGVVGYAQGAGPSYNTHAVLWNGSGVATDLNPTGFTYSLAIGTTGTQQVGFGNGTETGGSVHAVLWNGSSIATDLHPTNLAGFTRSEAYGTSGTQ